MFRSIFEKISPPKFLEVPYSAVIFSDLSIRFLNFNKENKKSLAHTEIILESGIIESGQVKNVEKLKNALMEIKHFKLTPFVRFAIPDEISYVFTSEIPVYPNKSAEEGVAFVLEENVPLSLSEAVFDFTPKKINKSSSGFSSTIAVTAVSSALVNSYVEAIKGASLEPILCVNESQAIAKAIVPLDSNENFIISYIHTDNVGTYVTEGQVVEFSSTAKISKNSNYVQVVISELYNAMKYLVENNKKYENKEMKCFICGRYEMCERALMEINHIKGVKSSLANVWINCINLEKGIPDISFENSLRFASAIGLFT